MSTIMEWVGCGFGLLGAFLLAINCRFSRWGWVSFLVSNAAWIAYSLLMGAQGLLLQQAGFTITSLIGLRRWFFGSSGNPTA